MLHSKELSHRSDLAYRILSSCSLCPRRCKVNRLKGELGYCKSDATLRIASVVRHFGEEPPLVGLNVGKSRRRHGAGTIFFSSCNLHCVYCQNYDISQQGKGTSYTPEELAAKIMSLYHEGAVSIEPVSPTHHLPGFLKALALVRNQGCSLPVVYNTNGYDTSETLDLLDGVVDIYLPDLRYASKEASKIFSDADNYVDVTRKAILTMHQQVGTLIVNDHSHVAERGLLIRILFLPNDVGHARDSLMWIKEHLPSDTAISLMSQYIPLYQANSFPTINRKVHVAEYEDIINFADSLGLSNIYIQDMDSQEIGIPDFDKKDPFTW